MAGRMLRWDGQRVARDKSSAVADWRSTKARQKSTSNLDEDQPRCGGDGGSVKFRGRGVNWRRDEKSRGGAAQKAHLWSVGGATKPEPQVYPRGRVVYPRGARCRHGNQ